MPKHTLSIVRHEVNQISAHNTFIVQVIEEDDQGKIVGEGPLTPLGISAQAMDNEFGGHTYQHFEKFLTSKKQQIIDDYRRTCECSEHGVKLVGKKL